MKKQKAQENQQQEKQPRAPRKLIAVEEKSKRGRWLTLLLFILSILFSYIVSLTAQ